MTIYTWLRRQSTASWSFGSCLSSGTAIYADTNTILFHKVHMIELYRNMVSIIENRKQRVTLVVPVAILGLTASMAQLRYVFLYLEEQNFVCSNAVETLQSNQRT